MRETDVLRLFLARVDNYQVTAIRHIRGRAYSVTMDGKEHTAVILPYSFAYYELQYHLSRKKPTLVICYQHNTVLPIPVLSLKAGKYAEAYELPDEIKDIEEQRHSKIGAQVLLGMYISGVRYAQELVNKLRPSTKYRYLQKARELGKRRKGRPVDTQQTKVAS